MNISIASMLWKNDDSGAVQTLLYCARDARTPHPQRRCRGFSTRARARARLQPGAFASTTFSFGCNGTPKANNLRQFRETEVRLGLMCAELVEEHCVER